MHAFVRGDFDVLLCTTIIESGLDIPNVNTILIDRADRFGLAELYQLRGRVGRYKRKAYAYLLLPKHGLLFDVARKRIGALKRHAQLGAGFQLALRIWRSAARATCSAPSRAATSGPWASTSTASCCSARSRR
jgi:transcription-repair coupling factor (superfamily II helicase)